jgi:hypothetical protein
MKRIIFLSLLLTGCAAKHFQVCVSHDGTYSCMLHALTKQDATAVGTAISGIDGDETFLLDKNKKHPPAPSPAPELPPPLPTVPL